MPGAAKGMAAMMTLFFLILSGTIIVGFGLYHFVFSDDGRKGQSERSASGSRKQSTGRATGVDS